MPWSPEQMHSHNHALHGQHAAHAASIANAVLKRSGDEGMALAVANKWAKRDDGGMVPAAPQPTPGLQPNNATMNPLIGQYVQRFAQMSPEQLQELLPRLSGSPLAAIAQHVLQQKRITPQPQAAPQPQQAMPQAGIPAQARGGATLRVPPMFSSHMGMPRRDAGGAAPFSNSMTPGQYTALPGVPGAFVGLVPNTQGPTPPGYGTPPPPPPTGGVTPLPGGKTSTPNLMQPGQTWASYLQGLFPQGGVKPKPPATPATGSAGTTPATGAPFVPTSTPLTQAQFNALTPAEQQADEQAQFQQQYQSSGTAGGNARGGALKYAKGGAHHNGTVPILAAGGEFVISPDHVARLGKGDVKAGHKLLDDFVVAKRKEIVSKMQSLRPPVKS